jgi:hypothetical protein
MIDLGTTNFYIGVPSMPRDEFENYSTRLFDEWEDYVEKTLLLSDYSLALEVEEGSVKGIGKIVAFMGALYVGIGAYGSFISGVQTIRDQVSSVGDFLGERAGLPFGSSGVPPKIRKHGGSLAHLQRLFVKVQRGDLTPDQAMYEAESYFGDDAATSPEFMKKLEESLIQTPRFHQQIQLPLDTFESEGSLPSGEKGRLPRPSHPKPVVPPPLAFRVEVWRDSKKEQRKIRVIQL